MSVLLAGFYDNDNDDGGKSSWSLADRWLIGVLCICSTIIDWNHQSQLLAVSYSRQ